MPNVFISSLSRKRRYIILIAILFGLLIWLIDAVLDYYIFYRGNGTLRELLFLNPPAHEIYIRIVIVCMFIAFGLLIYFLVSKSEQLMKKQQVEQRILLRITQNLIGVINYEEVLQIICDGMAELLDIDTAALYMIEDENKLYLGATTPPLDPKRSESVKIAVLQDHPHIMATVISRKSNFIPDTRTETLSEAEKNVTELRRLRSLLYLPFVHKDKTIGVLIVGTRNKLRTFSQQEIDFSQTVANQLSMGIINSRLHHELNENNQQLIKEVEERIRIEEALRNSEAHLSNALRIAKLGHWEYDVADDQFRFTDEFYELMRTNAEEMGGYLVDSHNYADRFVHPEDIHLVSNEIKRAIESNKKDFSAEIEHRIRYADGEFGNILVRYNIVKDNNGKTIKTLGVNQDITERKKVEEKLKESERKFRSLFDNLTAAMALHEMIWDEKGNPADFIFIDVNPAYEKLTLLKKEEIIGKKARDVIPGLEDKWFEYYSEVVKTGLPQTIIDHSDYLDKYWEILAYSPEKNKFAIVLSDITDRRKGEQLLLESEQKFRNIVENSPMGIHMYQLDENNRLIFTGANQAADKILGIDHTVLIGKTIEEAFPPLEKTDIPDKYKRATKYGESWSSEQVSYEEKEIIGAFEVNAFQTQPGRMVAMFLDITEKKKTESALKENERRFKEAENVAKIGYYVYNISSGYFTSSEGLDRIWGLDSEFVRSVENWAGLIHPDDLGMMVDHLQNHVLAGHNKFDKRYRIIDHTTKEIKWVHGQGDLSFDENNNPVEMFGTVQDVTNIKKTEEALHDSERRLSEAQSVAKLGHYLFDIKSGSWTNSKELDNIFGIDDKFERNVEGWIKLIHPEDVEMMTDHLLNHVIANHNRFDKRYRILDYKTGEEKWMHGLGDLSLDYNNNPIEMFGTIQDITNLMKAEQKLRDNEEKLNTLFEAMTEMVVLHEIILDDNGEPINYRIIDCNKTFTEVTGLSKEMSVGKLATDLYQSDQAPYLQEYCQVALTGKDHQFTTYYAPMDKHLMISAVSPKRGHFATITTDITSIKQIEEVIKSKNKELENYLYVASHDLRSPLVNIQGFSKRLEEITRRIKSKIDSLNLNKPEQEDLDKIFSKEVPKTLDFIYNGVLKMDKLINGLLLISRTGRVTMSIKEINMNTLIRDVIKAHDFQIEEAGAEVNIGDLQNCYGDNDLLNQLFSNIINNALKYRDSNRKLEIIISSTSRFKQVIYMIKDNGIGISPRHLEKIWDVFFQVNPKTNSSGEGIGLSIVKRIIDKHKGKISVESEEGRGCTFYIELQKNEFTE